MGLSDNPMVALTTRNLWHRYGCHSLADNFPSPFANTRRNQLQLHTMYLVSHQPDGQTSPPFRTTSPPRRLSTFANMNKDARQHTFLLPSCTPPEPQSTRRHTLPLPIYSPDNAQSTRLSATPCRAFPRRSLTAP